MYISNEKARTGGAVMGRDIISCDGCGLQKDLNFYREYSFRERERREASKEFPKL